MSTLLLSRVILKRAFCEYEPIFSTFQELELRQHKPVRTRSDHKPLMENLVEQVLQRDDLKSFADTEQGVELMKNSLIVDQLDESCYRQENNKNLRHSYLPPLESFKENNNVNDAQDKESPAWHIFFDGEKEYYVNRWAEALRSYFRPPNGEPYGDTLALVQTVDSLREMRAVPKRAYKDPLWLHIVEQTGLFDVINFICDPANLPCPSEPHVQRAYAMYSFKTAFGEIMKDWMPDDISLKVREPAPGKIQKNLKEFFDILDSNPAFVPQPWNPGAIFFLTCLDAFKTAWEEWLCPAILSTGQYPDNFNDGLTDHVLHANTFKWTHVQARADVYARCGRDITLINAPAEHEEKTDEQWFKDLGIDNFTQIREQKIGDKRIIIGAVRFRAFTEEHLGCMIEHSSHLKGYKGVK
ncbi:uncharacterized protein STEHIDRAFT_151321 [Stereum hirsutum FP-91666 SS1]|uniref:uncharacterized protein n=1 Tax=Stereum hirsutum (strain FP-91666) TaxID=721885 RepID=UPI000440DDE2|nr:uncharacterized protein STEHIDRAFT_151321 [Stereum hirsutum FP-91666 SS1]EIM91968.1 hypothetical protein STEHIDRAFT_151321 [Stereum hirsutum FP-91666 SS1]